MRITRCGSLDRRWTHGLSCRNKRLYFIWHNMNTRCHNQQNKGYRNYGAKGVTVCDMWRGSPETFFVWANQSGYSDTLTIDRIDSRLGYSPQNCRWVPKALQSGNRRNRQMYTAWGESKSVAEWLTDTRCTIKNRRLIRSRVYMRGWSPEDAMTRPVA